MLLFSIPIYYLLFSLLNKAVRFVYTTRVPVKKTDIFSFTLFANFLELIDLVDICAEQIIEWYVLVLMNLRMHLITCITTWLTSSAKKMMDCEKFANETKLIKTACMAYIM